MLTTDNWYTTVSTFPLSGCSNKAGAISTVSGASNWKFSHLKPPLRETSAAGCCQHLEFCIFPAPQNITRCGRTVAGSTQNLHKNVRIMFLGTSFLHPADTLCPGLKISIH